MALLGRVLWSSSVIVTLSSRPIKCIQSVFPEFNPFHPSAERHFLHSALSTQALPRTPACHDSVLLSIPHPEEPAILIPQRIHTSRTYCRTHIHSHIVTALLLHRRHYSISPPRTWPLRFLAARYSTGHQHQGATVAGVITLNPHYWGRAH